MEFRVTRHRTGRSNRRRTGVFLRQAVHRTRRYIGPAVVCAIVVVAVAGCKNDTNAMLERLKSVNPASYSDANLSKKSIAELKASIEALKNEVNRTVQAGTRLGTYYEIVGLRYMDQDMYGLAAQFFEKAINIYPENQALAYDAALCTAKVAQATADSAEKQKLFSDAATYYKNAIRLDPTYVDALYGLSILYVFEMNRPADAEPYLLTVLKNESTDFRAMFLLAQVYVIEGKTNDAIDLYNEIVDKSKNSDYVDQARKNISQLRGGT